MKFASLRKALLVACGAWMIGAGSAAHAEVDLSGVWIITYHEDWIELGTGPDIADFAGMPVTEAARQRALAWHPSLINVPERQCMELPMEYMDLWSNLRLWKEWRRDSQELVAYHLHKEWGATERTIWMDGRPHPGPHARHTFQGFSTGEFDGDKLKVTTTHLKEGYARRNGVPRSDQATVIEHFLRHGNHLTVSVITSDPMYLTQSWIRTSDYDLSISRNIAPYPCEIVTELASIKKGEIPFYYPWKNPFLKQFATKYGMPLETAMGGDDQMYPTFIE